MANLARCGREAGQLVLGGVVMLFGAALVEGIFRPSVHSIVARYLVAAFIVVLWIGYFAFTARLARREAA